MSTPNFPRLVADADRDVAVARLRNGLESGQLDTAAYERRVTTVLAAQTQDDLDAAVMDLPPVATSGSFELYPHKTVATYQPPVDADAPDPVPGQTRPGDPQGMSFKLGSFEVTNVPDWVLPGILVVALVGFMMLFGVTWLWWLIFFIPGVWGASKNHRGKRRRNRD